MWCYLVTLIKFLDINEKLWLMFHSTIPNNVFLNMLTVHANETKFRLIMTQTGGGAYLCESMSQGASS
jgi:hypothetical protein